MQLTFSTSTTGKLLDPGADDIIDRALNTATREATEAVEGALQGILRTVLVNPTGYYQRNIAIQRRQDYMHVVTDEGVVYGGWLEGTSSRNRSSRFKGYSAFRRATQQGERDAVAEFDRGAANLVRGLS